MYIINRIIVFVAVAILAIYYFSTGRIAAGGSTAGGSVNPIVDSNGYHKFTPKTEKLFKLAAYYFYQDRGQLVGVPCKPQDVKIEYGNFGEREYAHAYLNDAFPDYYKQFTGAVRDEIKQGYCKVYFNTAYIRPRSDNCVIFMHEYGHLVGHQHSSDINSPMYTGYVHQQYSTYAQILYNHNRMNIFAKSICAQPDIFNKPSPPAIKFG